MTALNKQALREAAEKALSARARLALVESVFTDDGDIIPEARADINTCTQFNDMSNPATVLALLDELEAANKAAESGIEWMKRCLAAEKRIAELTEALKQSTEGYKSCLRMGYDRIVDLGGDCDEPKVMINNNPDIQQSEKLLSAGIITKVGE